MKHTIPTCASCGANALRHSSIQQEFNYGKGADQVTLVADIPVFSCSECDFQFDGHDAAQIRHEAVCRHLNVHTPKQLKELRTRYKLSQAEFSEVTRIGTASIERWEAGLVIQNGAMDSLVFLAGFEENIRRLRQRNEQMQGKVVSASSHEKLGADLEKIFPSLGKLDESDLEKAKEFSFNPNRRQTVAA